MKCAMPAARAPGTSVSRSASSVSASRAWSRRNGTPCALASRGVSRTCAPPTVNASAPNAAPRMNWRLSTMTASSPGDRWIETLYAEKLRLRPERIARNDQRAHRARLERRQRRELAGEILGESRQLLLEEAVGLALRVAAARHCQHECKKQAAAHRFLPSSSCDCALRRAAIASSVR